MISNLKRSEPTEIELPYAPLNEEDSLTKLINEQTEEEEFKEIKEANTTEEDTKGQISEQIDYSQ